jgi:hypothetical protein
MTSFATDKRRHPDDPNLTVLSEVVPPKDILYRKKLPSFVWKFYHVDDLVEHNEKAKCDQCGIWLSYAKGSTTNLGRHLQKHDTYDPQKPQNIPPSALSGPQLSVEETKDIHRSLASFIITDYQALSLADSVGFRQFVKKLNPGYTVPSRQTITPYVLDLCDKVENTVRDHISKLQWLSLTMDGWTSRANTSFVMVTGHWIEDFEMKQCALAVRPLKESHTAVNLREVVIEVLQNMKFEGEIVAKVHDNARNIVKAMKLEVQDDVKEQGEQDGEDESSDTEDTVMFRKSVGAVEGQSIRCHAHVLNLVVTKSLKHRDLPQIKLMLKKVRKIVGHFNMSSSLKDLLLEEQKKDGIKTPLVVIQEVVTRWNSTYDMMVRIHTLRKYIGIVKCAREDHVLDENEPTLTEWKILEQVIEVLTPFKQATEALEGEKYPSLSLVNFFFHGISTTMINMSPQVDRNVRALIVKLQQELQSRDMEETVHLRNMVALLDPRTKTQVDDNAWDEFTDFVPKFVKQIPDEKSEDKPNKLHKIDGNLFTNGALKPRQTEKVLSLADEISLWRKVPPVDLFYTDTCGKVRYVNPLEWWKINGGKMKQLGLVAQIVNFSS